MKKMLLNLNKNHGPQRVKLVFCDPQSQKNKDKHFTFWTFPELSSYDLLIVHKSQGVISINLFILLSGWSLFFLTFHWAYI